MSKRDEQFMGFALALMKKIAMSGFEDFEHDRLIVARAAYDLVEHVLESPALNGKVVPGYGLLLDIATAPDLPVLPEEDAE